MIEFLDDKPETPFDRFMRAAQWFLLGVAFLAACIAAGIFFWSVR